MIVLTFGLFSITGSFTTLCFSGFLEDDFAAKENFTFKSVIIMEGDDFYLRYFVGHKGRYGHEFLEFELKADGRLRYGNNSNYRSDGLIRREVYINNIVIDDIKRIIDESEIMIQNDSKWPEPGSGGRQELEIIIGDNHICFVTNKIGSFNDVNESEDPAGMRILYYFIQDIKCLVFSLITLHFRVKPV